MKTQVTKVRRKAAELGILHDVRIHGIPGSPRSGRIRGRVRYPVRVLGVRRIIPGHLVRTAARIRYAVHDAHRRLLPVVHAEDPVR